MKTKRILRFYFYADSLNRAFDNIIYKRACSSAGGAREGGEIAEGICGLIAEKCELGELWEYLDRGAAALTGEELAALESYARLRCGIKRLGEEERKRIRRAAVKFTRRLRGISRFSAALALVDKYYCLIVPFVD